MSSYGGPAATPALDGLAADGVRFDFAHAHAVMTLPSHASILTGELPFTHGIRDNSGFRLPASARTAATMLKQAGFATGAFVGAFPLNARFGLNRGFDVYDDRTRDEIESNEFNMPERPATRVVKLARDWLAQRTASRRWFLWVHVFEPHAPYLPPPPFDAHYADRPYYGEVAAVDAALRPLLEDVRNASGLTLVIVTGDHGEGLGEHGEEAHGIFAYESTLRVPLIIAQVGGGTAASKHAEAGEVSSVAARHVDILPTILEAVGQAIPAGLPGRSLLSREERSASAPSRIAYFEAMSGMLNHGWAPLTGIVAGRDKLIDLPIAERYDLAGDPLEQSNVAGREPERDRSLSALLNGFQAMVPDARLTEDRDTRRQLRALGYVSAETERKPRYTEDDDPKRLIDIDRAIHDAINAYSDGRTEEAERIYRQLIARRPTMTFPHRRLALIEWRRGNAEAAVRILREAEAIGVRDVRLHAQLGEYLTGVGRTAEGIRILEPLAAENPEDPEILNALAIAYAGAGEHNKAADALERLVAAMPGSSIPYENLGVLALSRNDVAGARQYFERALAIAPESSRAFTGQGALAMHQGDRRAAYDAWGRAVTLDPDNYQALYNLGVNLARDGRKVEARPYLERFVKVAPPASHADQREVAAYLLR